jgi:MATE family multidrug resistance protein
MTDPAQPSLNRQVWTIAAPAMATNVATALFGVADIWVIGRLGDAQAQGAVEVGAKLMMTVLIIFNFLRTGTVGLTAQAAGRGNVEDQAATLARGLAAALAIGAVVVVLRHLLTGLGLRMLGAGPGVAHLARTYVQIRFWGALAWLINAVLTGWLIGRRRVRAVMAVEIAANLAHVALDLTFVLVLHLGVAGVAIATVLSETLKLLALATVTAREAPARTALTLAGQWNTWRPSDLWSLFRLNRDLLGRTMLLMVATVLLTRAGARQGAVVLAANAVLYQLFNLSALLLDGFESAAQVLCGEALGARRGDQFARVIRANLAWGFAIAALVSLAYALLVAPIAAGFSTDPQVVRTILTYAGWAMAMPLAGVASFVFDGVFIGSSWTRAMLVTMAVALATFVGAFALARPLGNNGLWLAFILFLVVRALGQAALLPGLTRRAFAQVPPRTATA